MTPEWLPRSFGPLIVRAISESDLDPLYDLETDPRVKQFIVGRRITKTRAEWVRCARKFLSSDEEFALEQEQSHSFAGRLSVNRYLSTDVRYMARGCYEIQVLLIWALVGGGLGKIAAVLATSIAFRELGASAVFGVVHPEHPRSVGLLDELGFVEIEPERDDRGEVKKRIFRLSSEVANDCLLRLTAEDILGRRRGERLCNT